MADIIDNRFAIVEGEPPRHGGQSIVRKAIDLTNGTAVAVKLFSALNDDLSKRIFTREVDVMKRLTHANIIGHLHSGFDESHTPYLVVRWLDRSLQDYLDEYAPVDWREFINSIVLPLTSAVDHAHRIALEHRDIKPQNVLMSGESDPILIDFGIGKSHAEASKTDFTLRQFRSGLYTPPNVGDDLRYVRDVYSLAVLFIQATALKPATDYFELEEALESVDLPSGLAGIFRDAISGDTAKRPANAIIFHDLLRSEMAAENSVEIPVTTVPIRLTKSAMAHAVGENAFPDGAPDVIAEDLSGETHIAYRWDSGTGLLDRTMIMLTGASMRLTLKLEGRVLVVTGISHPTYEELERARRIGLSSSRFLVWTTKSMPTSYSSDAVDLLLDRLDAFERDKNEAVRASDAVLSVRDLVHKWKAVLNARVAMAQSQSTSIPYVDASAYGPETEFIVGMVLESDLVGSDLQLRDVKSDVVTARGTLVQQDEFKLKVRWAWNSNKTIPKKGILDPYFAPTAIAFQRQRDALQLLENRESARPDLIDILTDPSRASLPKPVADLEWSSELDSDKRNAVRAALGSESCITVMGPPGTGKTRFIAETVLQALRLNPDARVLIVSQTHVAVDNAIERLEDAGIDAIVRLGDRGVGDKARHLVLESQLDKWAQQVREAAETHMADLAANANTSTRHLQGIMRLKELRLCMLQLTVLERALEDAVSAADGLATTLDLADDPKRIRQKIDSAAARLQWLLTEYETLVGDDLALSSAPDVEEVEIAIELLSGQSDMTPETLVLLELQAEWLQRVNSDDHLADVFLRSARVIAGTCLGFVRHRAIRDLDIDLCIIDEASKASSTEALVPLVRARRFILVGDANQLPPLDEDLIRDQQLLDEFELSPEIVKETLFDRLSENLPESNRFALTEQYRMTAAIGDLVSQIFYQGRLTSPSDHKLQGQDLLGKPVLWLDTSAIKNRTETADERSSGSYLNHLEADTVVGRLEDLNRAVERRILHPKAPAATIHVLVIAPYRSQIDELTRRLVGANLPHLSFEIQSVDAVQGREADFVIFSVTRSNPEGSLGFLGENYWRRINVALSRARYSLTIVGDAEFCRNRPGALMRVLSYMSKNEDDCEMRQADVPD